MDEYKILEIKESVFADNDREADALRASLKERGQFLLNLMSSPGSGKTTTLSRTIEALGDELALAVMEADIDSDVDAATIAKLGAKTIQLHTGGMCHLDAGMCAQGLEGLAADDADLVFLENVGNLVCPTDFDLGENAKVMILSVPEGDDKPLKYPGVFQVSEAVILNKVDTMPVFNFNQEAFEESVNQLNPQAPIFPLSATTGEGLKAWTSWLAERIRKA